MYPLLDILIPRFVTDELAGTMTDDETFTPLCLVKELRPDDIYTHTASVQSFNLFGLALFPKMIVETLREVRP